MHETYVDEMKNKFKNELNSLPGTKYFSNVTAIDMNDDFTEFTLTTTAKEATEEEPLLSLWVYMYGKIYNILNLTEANVVTVYFISVDSGEIIYTSDVTEMDEVLKSAE